MSLTIGFTGTQKGLTDPQKKALREELGQIAFRGGLKSFNPKGIQFRHGDCIGADFIAWYIAIEEGYYVVSHPPLDESKQAKTKNDFTCTRKEYLARNRDIVESCDVLFVCPDTMKEKRRSGTWFTYRYARKQYSRPTAIFWPDGTVTKTIQFDKFVTDVM